VRSTGPSGSWEHHQFRNFGEDVYRKLRDDCEISIEEIDKSTNEFHLRKIHKRAVRTIAAQVRQISEKSKMSDVIEVEEIETD
jgi:hypothetical protein